MIPAGLLPEGTVWCIAGGWAACPALAADQDVWVLIDTEETSLEDAREQLLDHLRSYFATDPNALAEVNDERIADPKDYDNTMVHILKVAEFYEAKRKIHVMVTDAPSARYLLRTFDISTHQIAIEADGRVIKGDDWTPFSVPPVRLRETKTTSERMVKIAARYSSAPAETTTLTDDDIPF